MLDRHSTSEPYYYPWTISTKAKNIQWKPSLVIDQEHAEWLYKK